MGCVCASTTMAYPRSRGQWLMTTSLLAQSQAVMARKRRTYAVSLESSLPQGEDSAPLSYHPLDEVLMRYHLIWD